jgi:hypothetical protein
MIFGIGIWLLWGILGWKGFLGAFMIAFSNNFSKELDKHRELENDKATLHFLDALKRLEIRQEGDRRSTNFPKDSG